MWLHIYSYSNTIFVQSQTTVYFLVYHLSSPVSSVLSHSLSLCLSLTLAFALSPSLSKCRPLVNKSAHKWRQRDMSILSKFCWQRKRRGQEKRVRVLSLDPGPGHDSNRCSMRPSSWTGSIYLGRGLRFETSSTANGFLLDIVNRGRLVAAQSAIYTYPVTYRTDKFGKSIPRSLVDLVFYWSYWGAKTHAAMFVYNMQHCGRWKKRSWNIAAPRRTDADLHTRCCTHIRRNFQLRFTSDALRYKNLQSSRRSMINYDRPFLRQQ